nr:response regulator [Anaerolineae bacterium]
MTENDQKTDPKDSPQEPKPENAPAEIPAKKPAEKPATPAIEVAAKAEEKKPAPAKEPSSTAPPKTEPAAEPGAGKATAAAAEATAQQPSDSPPADPGKEPPADAAGKKSVMKVEPAEAHVLVVEDNVPNFVLIARLLAYMGIQRCEWKTSGWQVVEFADTLPRIDLILMDIRLPYEDGFQALEKVRASARLKETLVVAVTAEASVEQMKRAQEAGFDGFLGKPLDPDRFPEQIRRVLSGEPVWEMH